MCEIGGKEYPIEGYCNVVNENKEIVGKIPIVALPMMSDYEWFLWSLDSRLKKPHLYEDENNEDIKKHIKNWLIEHTTIESYSKHVEKYPLCLEYIFGDINCTQ